MSIFLDQKQQHMPQQPLHPQPLQQQPVTIDLYVAGFAGKTNIEEMEDLVGLIDVEVLAIKLTSKKRGAFVRVAASDAVRFMAAIKSLNIADDDSQLVAEIAISAPFDRKKKKPKKTKTVKASDKVTLSSPPSVASSNDEKQEASAADKSAAAAVRPKMPKSDMSLVDVGFNLARFNDKQLDALLQRATDANVSRLICTGTSLASSLETVRRIRALREKHHPLAHVLFCTVGVHPHEADTCDENTMRRLEELVLGNKDVVVGIGECGLDFNRMRSERKVQESVFAQQIDLANRVELPLFCHERDAHEAFVAVMERVKPQTSFVMGCFAGTTKEIAAYVELGAFIGLSGMVAKKKRGETVRDALATGTLPVNRLLLHTHAPFMMPDMGMSKAVRKQLGRTNEPCTLPATCKVIGDCLGVSSTQVALQTTLTAFSIFGIH